MSRTPLHLRREQLLDERADLINLLEQLEADDWTKPTRCPGWTVADVAGHVIAWEHLLGGPTTWSRAAGTIRLLWLATTCRFAVDRMNERLRRRSPAARAEALAAFAARPPGDGKWRFDRLTPGAQLAELVLHHEDIRHAVDRPRTIPPDRLATALRGVERLPGLPRPRKDGRDLDAIDALLARAGR